MHEAQAIGTYDISAIPDQDCCTLFVPRHPATRTALAHIEALEKALDMPALVDLAVNCTHSITLSFPAASAVLPTPVR
jgi:thiamine biosynthesis protein ThiI